ncbi:MAG: hypothetical protein D6788_01530 [Planctomycetota bacterium]|nr:MAG: hypothetical protein D6788_01530 [Planctomycetota bacterium]
MKSANVRRIGLAVALGLLPGPVRAGVERAPAPPPSSGNPPSRAEVEAAKQHPEESAAVVSPRVRQYLKALTRLRKQLDERLELSPEQRDALDRVFASYRKRLTDPQSPIVDSIRGMEELRRVRGEIDEARTQNDRTRLARLQARFRALMEARREGAAAFDRFVRQVSDILTDVQRPVLKELVRELEAGGAGRPLHPKLRVLQRAALHPMLHLTSARKRRIAQILADGSRELEAAGNDPAALDRAYEHVKTMLMQAYSSKERKQVQFYLDLYTQAPKIRKRLRSKRMQERKKQKRIPAETGKKKETPAEPKSEPKPP